MRERRARIATMGALARVTGALPPRLQILLSGQRQIVVDGQRFDPGVQLMLSSRERLGAPDWATLSPEQGRAFTREEAAMARGRVDRVARVRDLEVPGAAGPLRARHYTPFAEPSGPRPLLVFLHGGGFVAGDLDTHDAPCRTLCRHAGVHVLAIDYRLAPEHPFPAAQDDALAAFAWAVEHAASLGADAARVAVGGDSAGGNLSAVVAQAGARGDVAQPAAQLLVYPATDATRRRRSHTLFAERFFLTSALIEWYEGHFLPEGSDVTDPRRSPLLAADLSGQAPAIVITAGFDPLRDEGEDYARALAAAGVPVVARRYESLFHGFLNAGGINRASRAALLEMAGMLRALLDLEHLDAAGGRERAGVGEHVGPGHLDAA